MENIKPFCVLQLNPAAWSRVARDHQELMIQTMALPRHHWGLQESPSPAPPAEKAKHGGGKAFHFQPAAGTGMQQPL